MKYGLKLSEKQIEQVDFLLKTHNNRATFKYKAQTLYAIIGTYDSLKASLFDKFVEAKEIKEAAINYIMDDFLGEHFVSTQFAVRMNWMETNELVMIYSEVKPIPKDLFKNPNEFEFFEEPKRIKRDQ